MGKRKKRAMIRKSRRISRIKMQRHKAVKLKQRVKKKKILQPVQRVVILRCILTINQTYRKMFRILC